MASTIKSAIPSHLKPSSAAGNGEEADFVGKHHGKTRSHMVSTYNTQLSMHCTFATRTRPQTPEPKPLSAAQHLETLEGSMLFKSFNSFKSFKSWFTGWVLPVCFTGTGYILGHSRGYLGTFTQFAS